MSFSQVMGPSFRQTVAGLFSHPRMNVETMLSGHIAATLQRAEASEGDYLLAAQDTTFYNYTGQAAMEGLGYIQEKTRGVIQHNLLLMNEQGLPLGLLDQQYWSREGSHPFEGKESQKWFRGLEAANKHLGKSAKRVVVVQDREADILEFFKAPRAEAVDLLVRLCQPRRLEVLHSGQVLALPEVSAGLRDFGQREVPIQKGSKPITLTLRLRGGLVEVYPDRKRSARLHKSAPLSLLVAEQVEAGQDSKEKVCWYLLSSLPLESEEDAHRLLDFYALRWRVERLHYTLKSGALQVEKLQFDDLTTLINALTFYSIVACQLLRINYLVRAEAEAEARVCWTKEEVKLLARLSKKPISTVGEATLALARIVGFAPSRKQPWPGLKVLAQALERFYYIKMGNAL